MAVIQSRKEAAEALDITERSLDRWRLEPGFPDDSKGFDIEKIEAWRAQREKKGSEAADQLSTLTRATKAARLKEINNRLTLQEFEIKSKSGELLPRDLVHDLLMEVASTIRGLGAQLQRAGNTDAAKMIEAQMDRLKRTINDRIRERLRTATRSNPK